MLKESLTILLQKFGAAYVEMSGWMGFGIKTLLLLNAQSVRRITKSIQSISIISRNKNNKNAITREANRPVT
jgi:hypothetical protein